MTFRSDLLHKLNSLNLGIQGPSENIYQCNGIVVRASALQSQ